MCMHTDDEFPRVFGIKDQDPRGAIKLPNSSPHSGPEIPSSYSHILAGRFLLLLTPPSSFFFPFSLRSSKYSRPYPNGAHMYVNDGNACTRMRVWVCGCVQVRVRRRTCVSAY